MTSVNLDQIASQMTAEDWSNLAINTPWAVGGGSHDSVARKLLALGLVRTWREHIVVRTSLGDAMIKRGRS